MDLPSLHIMVLPKLPSVDAQNTLAAVVEFHTAFPLTKECIHTQRREAVDSYSQNSPVLLCPSLSRSSWIDRKGNNLLKTQGWHQTDGRGLQVWGTILQKAVYASDQQPGYDQDAQAQESRGGSGTGAAHHYPQCSTSKSFASRSPDLMFSWLGSLSSRGEGRLVPGSTYY